ncbi:MAG: GDSL-type esterase/lipase family protein [Hespellia sp.]|nr:GDSL-type esterase/lipase family protein [Hespellia sp.]
MMSTEKKEGFPADISKEIMGFFENEKRDKVKRLENLNKYIKKNQILFTGSSLMEHFPIEEFRMSMDLEPRIYNRGIGGFTTEEFLENIDTMLLSPEPSKVFINIGTNDISERFNQEGKWLERLISNYEQILKRLQEKLPECEVYMMAYYPANETMTAALPWTKFRTNERIIAANNAVKDLAAKLGYHFINVNEGLADTDGNLKREITTDGIHMIPDAYTQILHNMMPYL